ncbi:sugar isomerase domain-containing protein [Devosia sp.]|uniref:sugar isomerase domain-containing protein n=1 Tax=Devosia sp. TaxID=1871048 RepID=UPI003A8CD401
MTALRRTYRDQIVAILDRIVTDQTQAMDAARDAVAAALQNDRLIYVAGSGHSHILAEEVFYRAGGIAAAQAILDPALMLHEGAELSTQTEREPGRAEQVLARYPVGPGDVVFVASNSGRNAYPIEMALAARARGATTIALTSLTHSQQISSRHESGKLLHEVADLVLDNAGSYGDAGLNVGAGTMQMGPTSTIAGVFILNALLAEAVDLLAQRGISVDVYQSANMEGAEAASEALIARWRPRIVGL